MTWKGKTMNENESIMAYVTLHLPAAIEKHRTNVIEILLTKSINLGVFEDVG